MKKGALVVCPFFPYPPRSGGTLDVYNRLVALGELGYEITLIAYFNPAEPPLDRRPLEELGIRLYPLPYLRRELKKLLSWKPYYVGSRENYGELNPIIAELKRTKTQYPFLIAESHHVLGVAHLIKGELAIPKLLLRSHNNEPKFLLSLARSSPIVSLRRYFFAVEALRYLLYERSLLGNLSSSDAILHISHDEWLLYKRRYPAIRQEFLPAALNLKAMSAYKASPSQRVCFIGALFSPNNLDGLYWYLQKVHPLLCKKLPGYELLIAGNTQGADLSRLRRLILDDKRVLFHDTPENLEPLYNSSALFINPMRYGAGVKLKSVEALLNGLPIVTTSTGAEGTGLIHARHLLLADTPSLFTDQIASLLRDVKMREKLVAEGQNFLKTHYNTSQALSRILSEIRSQ